MKVVYAEESIEDLQKVYDYFLSKDIDIAKRVIQTIHAVTGKLESFPYMGAVVHGDVRRIISTRYGYIVYYRVLEDDSIIQVAHIVSSRQDFAVKDL